MNQPPLQPPVIAKLEPVARPLPRGEGSPRSRLRLHPFSGVLVIVFDWIFFGATVITEGLALPFSCVAAFTLTTIGVYLAQRHLDGDSRGASAAKAFFGGVMAGLPFPIAGTILGALVLSLSGLSAFDLKRK